jgi:hypothetical protein
MDYGRGNLMTPDTFGTEHIGHPARQRVIETSRWLGGHADVDGPAPALQIPVQDQPAGRLSRPGRWLDADRTIWRSFLEP